MNNMEAKIIEILESLGSSKVESTSQRIKEDLGVNSLNTVMMIVMVEEAFGIELAEADLNPALFTTVEAVVELVERYVRAKENEDE